MNLKESEEQTHFRQTVRRVLAEYGGDEGGSVDRTAVLWGQAVRAGWLDLADPADFRDTALFVAILFEEFGRAALPSPVTETLLTRLFAAVAGVPPEETPAASSSPFPGSASLAVSHARTRAELPIASQRADGSVDFGDGDVTMAWGASSQTLFIPVRLNGGAGVAVVRSDPDLSSATALDDEPVARVNLPAVSAGGAIRLAHCADPQSLWDALTVASLFRACEMIGCGKRALEMTASHVSVREQFGRPLAALQSVQHKLADMWLGLEGAELLVSEAVWKMASGNDFRGLAEAAVFAAGRGGEALTLEAAHLHGGLGYMEEYPLHRYYRRMKAQRLRQGSVARQLQGVAREYLPAV